jgi:AraC-like DNA-binding protein
MEFIGRSGEYFGLHQFTNEAEKELIEQKDDTLLLLWFTEDDNLIEIDHIPYTFNKNELLCLTQFHQLTINQLSGIRLMRFNRPFYCILDHDSEVGCKGILYYGAAKLPILRPSQLDINVLSAAWKVAELEFEMKDDLQLEMLQMILKRILILCTRIHTKQGEAMHFSQKHNDLVREFNFLVEIHFRKKHSIAAYAELLFKSPKTISNTFYKLGLTSPLQLIQERLLLESRRLLWYTDKDISIISDELGFNDIQSFSRFFKKHEGISPSTYRKSKELEKK